MMKPELMNRIAVHTMEPGVNGIMGRIFVPYLIIVVPEIGCS